MLTALSDLSQSLSFVVRTTMGASVFSLLLQACWFGMNHHREHLVKFDLGSQLGQQS